MRKHLLYTDNNQTIRIIMHRAHGSNDGIYILQKNNSQWIDEDRINSWDEMAIDRVMKWAEDNNLHGSIMATKQNIISEGLPIAPKGGTGEISDNPTEGN